MDKEKHEVDLPEDRDQELVSDIKTGLRQLDYDVTIRNDYMNTRDRALYGDGLYSGLEIDSWFAEYNYTQRVIDIHTAQLMGRGFNVYSYYEKEDIPEKVPGTPETPEGQEPDPSLPAPPSLDDVQGQVKAKNKLAKINADLRKKAIDSIIRDNGGMDMFKRGARQGSAYGNTVYKAWFDPKTKKYIINLIESVHNYRRGWADTNFRDSDFDSYVYQISIDKANRLYGDKLKPGESFEWSQEGEPLMDAFGGGNTGDPLNQTQTDIRPKETTRPMVTVIDFTGYRSKWGVEKGNLTEVEAGKESPFSVLIVGDKVVQTITDPKRLPKYYFIPNRVEPRRAWGRSDLPQSALDINREVIQLMADQRTWADKNLFRLIQAKGFTPSSIPRKKPRKTQVVAMSQEQSLEEMPTSQQSLQEWKQLVDQRIDAFVRLTGVGRVLFDDPSVTTNSNQALMTTLKGVVDIVEDKQSRWEPELTRMFTDALYTSAEFLPEMKPFVTEDPGWYLNIEWPSVLRREDATYQTMWLNLFNAGVISIDTYHQKIGIPDSTEEIERIKDNMADVIASAIMGHSLPEVAHQTLNKSLGIPSWGTITPKVQLRGDLAPEEVGNMAANYGWDKGPYGDGVTKVGFNAPTSTMDPTPDATLPMNESYAPAPMADPQMTSDNNTGMAPTSQPGSGATPVSPEGAIAQQQQQAGM